MPNNPTPPGQTDYADAKARLVALLDENAWLTAFGGHQGTVPQGQFKAGYLPRATPSTGARGEPRGLNEERTFDWATRHMAASSPTFDKAGLLAGGFRKRDTANQLISIGEDIEEWARTGEFPRLEDLRHVTYPGIELYRRTYLTPVQAAEDLQRSQQAAFFVRGQETMHVMEAKHALTVGAAVESELRLTLSRAAGAEAAKAVRIASTGRLREGRAGKQPVSWLTYIMFNARPSLFVSPNELRYQLIVRMAAVASAESQGWHISFGREHIDVVANGLRVSFLEAPEASNIGALQLFASGPEAYTQALQANAAQRGWLLNPFGLFQASAPPAEILQGRPKLRHVPMSLVPLDFSSADWHLQGERRIFNALGLAYHTPAERLAGALPSNA